ncbi:hypothetical protein [Chondromyces apiculatus]|uniref:Uncharacterized protein n=1 Tax=Chondromyces apiculatus DSM 436 TaxID=1192034 RepID=A0A017TCX5_9BACT|nr:hypothetical protein [Chondromyces apiculatus]EYF07059.1 Hypothetical protein CAP_1318 [Chondromyces apiculatus DSM 436]
MRLVTMKSLVEIARAQSQIIRRNASPTGGVGNAVDRHMVVIFQSPDQPEIQMLGSEFLESEVNDLPFGTYTLIVYTLGIPADGASLADAAENDNVAWCGRWVEGNAERESGGGSALDGVKACVAANGLLQHTLVTTDRMFKSAQKALAEEREALRHTHRELHDAMVRIDDLTREVEAARREAAESAVLVPDRAWDVLMRIAAAWGVDLGDGEGDIPEPIITFVDAAAAAAREDRAVRDALLRHGARDGLRQLGLLEGDTP